MPKVLQAARAFAVVFGGSLVLDAAAGASVATMARSLRRRRRPPRWALAGTATTAVYAGPIRRWMAGRHEIEIDAPVRDVWPWIAQIGQDRGGFYSHDWLENIAGCRMHSADRIHPEWQHREIGETVYLHPARGLPVTRFEPRRELALQNWGPFRVESRPGGRTHLSVGLDGTKGSSALAYALLMELPHYIMERKMLVGIKRRAQQAA